MVIPLNQNTELIIEGGLINRFRFSIRGYHCIFIVTSVFDIPYLEGIFCGAIISKEKTDELF
jgi:hypothetical protein